MNEKLKMVIIILAILLAETAILGMMAPRLRFENTLFRPLGFVATFESILTEKNGLEVRDYNYSWTTVYHSETGITTYNLDMDVSLYSYYNGTNSYYNGTDFNCTALTEINNNNAQDVDRDFFIQSGENNIRITRTSAETKNLTGLGFVAIMDLTGFSFTLTKTNDFDTEYYEWEISDGTGESSYHQNSLYPDGYLFTHQLKGYYFDPDILLATFLYVWLPTLVIFVLGFYAYWCLKPFIPRISSRLGF